MQDLLGQMTQALAGVLRGSAAQMVDAVTDAATVESNGGEGEPRAYDGPQREQNLRTLTVGITPHAGRLLRTIAEASLEGGSINSTELRAALNSTSVSQVAGWAASIGFAVKRTGLPRPYSQKGVVTENSWENVYSMDPDVAKTILELLDEEGSLRK